MTPSPSIRSTGSILGVEGPGVGPGTATGLPVTLDKSLGRGQGLSFSLSRRPWTGVVPALGPQVGSWAPTPGTGREEPGRAEEPRARPAHSVQVRPLEPPPRSRRREGPPVPLRVGACVHGLSDRLEGGLRESDYRYQAGVGLGWRRGWDCGTAADRGTAGRDIAGDGSVRVAGRGVTAGGPEGALHCLLTTTCATCRLLAQQAPCAGWAWE